MHGEFASIEHGLGRRILRPFRSQNHVASGSAVQMKEEIFASRETRREDIVRLIASAHPDFKTLATAISTRMQLTRHVSVRGGKRRNHDRRARTAERTRQTTRRNT